MSDYASMVHAAAFTLVQTAYGSAFTSYRKTPMLRVYILRERREQDGQANQTVPHFKHTLTLGFSGAIQMETDNQNELSALEETMAMLDDILLCQPKFINLVEGVTMMDRVGQYAKVGEITLYEIRIEMAMEFSSRFEPTIPDDLERVVITTQFPDAAHVESGTPQLEQNIEIDTST
jgi:hypothetical protein